MEFYLSLWAMMTMQPTCVWAAFVGKTSGRPCGQNQSFVICGCVLQWAAACCATGQFANAKAARGAQPPLATTKQLPLSSSSNRSSNKISRGRSKTFSLKHFQNCYCTKTKKSVPFKQNLQNKPNSLGNYIKHCHRLSDTLQLHVLYYIG